MWAIVVLVLAAIVSTFLAFQFGKATAEVELDMARADRSEMWDALQASRAIGAQALEDLAAIERMGEALAQDLRAQIAARRREYVRERVNETHGGIPASRLEAVHAQAEATFSAYESLVRWDARA